MLVMDGRESLLKSDDEDELIFDHTSLLNKEISFRDLSKKLYANGCKLQIARTINLCFSFFGLGLCFAIPTATLEDLKRSTGAGLDIRHIYTARYSGYLFGSLLGGFLFDRYNRQFLLFLSLLATSIGVIVMPFCSNVTSLMACTAITGITMGFLDTGGNVWCLDLWGRRSAPIMQTLHFCFGLGAFVAPLVAEPFLSPLYLNTSIGFEGNSTTGNATHRISHINFLHSGAPIKNLVQRAVENSNLSPEILADYEFSKYRHFMFKRNATDNSSDDITFGNINEMQQNASTQNPDDLLNTTSSTTVVPARTFKPKPQYADGNQLRTKDKWDRPSNKIQSTIMLQNSNSTTTVAPLTTQHPESVSPRNDSEQNNSSSELTQDEKGNATFDSESTAASQVSDNTTLEDVKLVDLSSPHTTQPIVDMTTKETSSTVTPEVTSTSGSSQNFSSPIPTQDGIQTVTRELTSTSGSSQNFSSPISTQDGIQTLPILNTVATTNKWTLSTVNITTEPSTNLQHGNVPLQVGPTMKAETTAQSQSDKTTLNVKENIHTETGMKGNNITMVSTLSSKGNEEDVNGNTTTVVSQPFSEYRNASTTTSVESPTISSTTMSTATLVESPTISSTSFASPEISRTFITTTTSTSTSAVFLTMLKQSFEHPKESTINNNETTGSTESVNNNENTGSTEAVPVNEASHDSAGTKQQESALPTSPTRMDTTDRLQYQRGSGLEKPDSDLNTTGTSNFGESQPPISNNLRNVSETTSSSSSDNVAPSILKQSQNPSSENETPKKPSTLSTNLVSSKETKNIPKKEK